MILRIYYCTIVVGKEKEFRSFAFSKSHPWLKQRPGLLAFYAAKPLPKEMNRKRCMVQLWESEAALEAALGANWRNPTILSDEIRSFIESATVEHYEVADEYHFLARDQT